MRDSLIWVDTAQGPRPCRQTNIRPGRPERSLVAHSAVVAHGIVESGEADQNRRGVPLPFLGEIDESPETDALGEDQPWALTEGQSRDGNRDQQPLLRFWGGQPSSGHPPYSSLFVPSLVPAIVHLPPTCD